MINYLVLIIIVIIIMLALMRERENRPFYVYSIQFNWGAGSKAIPLKWYYTDDYVHTEAEWVYGTRSEPAAYVKGTSSPLIKVVFRRLFDPRSESYTVWATGSMGGVHPVEVIPVHEGDTLQPIFPQGTPLVFQSDDLSVPIYFSLKESLPDHIGKHRVDFHWYVKSADDEDSTPLGTTSHIICTTWKKIEPGLGTWLSDWVYKQPMLWTSEWASGKDNEKDICDAIIQNLHLSGMKYGIPGWDIRTMLHNGGGMCGGWFTMFQHLAHCQGVFVHRRCYLVDWRELPDDEVKWCAIVIKSGGLNQPEPTLPYSTARAWYDVDSQYPIEPTTPINTVSEVRWRFRGSGTPGVYGDGHCINFLVYEGKLYLYDPSFGTGPFEIAPFTGAETPLPASDSVIGGTELSSFKSEYLNTAVDYMEGALRDGAENLYECPLGITVKNLIIPDETDSFKEITFYWY